MHPLIEQGTLRLAAWFVSGMIWKQKEYQQGLQHLSQMPVKLTMLSALTSASRASEICYLDINLMTRNEEKCIFGFSKITKGCRQNKPRPEIAFVQFLQDPMLCVCKTLDYYVDRTKVIRGKITPLLISHIKPHRKVVVCTVSRWLKEALKLAGIDTSTFTGHSTRAASTSKAKVTGVSIQDIVKRGHWSNKSTFTKHYNRDIVPESCFQNGVLIS